MDLTINITGHTDSDIETAIDEIRRLVGQGYRSGGDSNGTGSFNFDISGSPIENYAIAIKGDTDDLSEARFTTYDEASEAAGEDDTVVGLSDSGEVISL